MQQAPVRRRTFPITLLAVVSAIAGINAFIDIFRYLGWLPILPGGDLKLFQVNWLGAIFAGILALIWFSVAAQLWRLDPRGWLFVVLIASLNLILLVLSLIGQSSWQSVSWGIIISGLALILALLPSTKAAFGVENTQQKPRA